MMTTSGIDFVQPPLLRLGIFLIRNQARLCRCPSGIQYLMEVVPPL